MNISVFYSTTSQEVSLSFPNRTSISFGDILDKLGELGYNNSTENTIFTRGDNEDVLGSRQSIISPMPGINAENATVDIFVIQKKSNSGTTNGYDQNIITLADELEEAVDYTHDNTFFRDAIEGILQDNNLKIVPSNAICFLPLDGQSTNDSVVTNTVGATEEDSSVSAKERRAQELANKFNG